MTIDRIDISDTSLPLGGGLNIIRTSPAARGGVRRAVLEHMPGVTEQELLGRCAAGRAALTAADDPMADAELARLEMQCAEAERRMRKARSDQRRRTLAALGTARGGAERAQKELTKAQAELERAQAALDALPHGDMEPAAAGERTERDARAVERAQRLTEALPPMWLAYIPLALAGLAFVLTVFVPWKGVCAAAGCVLAAAFAAVLLRLRPMRAKERNAQRERQRLLRDYGVSSAEEMRALTERHESAWAARERAAAHLAAAEKTLDGARAAQEAARTQTLEELDFAHGDSEAARAGREAEELKSRASALRRRREASLAAAENELLPADGAPVVLEDALSGMGVEAMARALTFIHALAAKRQVILITADTREEEYFADDADVCSRVAE